MSNESFTETIEQYSTKDLAQNYLHILFISKHFRCFRNFYSSNYPSSFFVAFSLSGVDPTSFGHLPSRTFLHHRPFHTATSVVSFHCLLSYSSTTTMNTKKNTVSTSSQATKTVANPNINTLKAAIFRTLDLKLATELNTGTVLSTPRRAFFKICKTHSYSQARRYRLNSITAYILQAQK